MITGILSVLLFWLVIGYFIAIALNIFLLTFSLVFDITYPENTKDLSTIALLFIVSLIPFINIWLFWSMIGDIVDYQDKNNKKKC